MTNLWQKMQLCGSSARVARIKFGKKRKAHSQNSESVSSDFLEQPTANGFQPFHPSDD